MRQFGRRRPARRGAQTIKQRAGLRSGLDGRLKKNLPVLIRASGFESQLKTGARRVSQLQRKATRLRLGRRRKSHCHIGAGQGVGRLPASVRRDGAHLAQRLPRFGKNPTVDPNDLTGGGRNPLDVNPGSFLHCAQAG